MPRKWILVTIAVVIVLLVADVAAASIENRRVATALSRSEHLTASPYVHINGWPFIVQGVRGRYRSITLQADPAHTSGAASLTVHPLRLSIYDVRTSGGFDHATAERAVGTARIGYRSLSAEVDRRVRYAGSGRVVARVAIRVGGRTYRPSVSAVPKVRDGALVFREIDTTDQRGLPASAASRLAQVFAGRAPLGRFPFGLTPHSVDVGPGGLTFAVRGTDVHLDS